MSYSLVKEKYKTKGIIHSVLAFTIFTARIMHSSKLLLETQKFDDEAREHTLHREGKRRRHTLSKTTRTQLSLQATRKHKVFLSAGWFLRRIMSRKALEAVDFFVKTLLLHLLPLVVLFSLS